MIIETQPLYEKVDGSSPSTFTLTASGHAGETRDKNPFSILQLFNSNNL